MWNLPSKAELAALPKLYSTEGIPIPEKIVHMHFFLGPFDWYIVEFDGQDAFFGYAHIANAPDCSEWGYFSLTELAAINHHGIEVVGHALRPSGQ